MDDRQIEFGSIGEVDFWRHVQRLFQEDVLQMEDRIEAAVGSPEASLHALGSGGRQKWQ
jgi:hypothetical protein